MVTVSSKIPSRAQSCPHCHGRQLMWDDRDNEPYCLACGWRRHIRITAEQSRLRAKWTTWVQLLAEVMPNADDRHSIIRGENIE